MTSTPLDSGTVTLAVADGVATVTFAHPKSNSLPGVLLRALADTITAAGNDPSARVVVLRSGPGPFCAGASFDEMVAITDPAQGKEFFLGFARVILAMIRAPKPVVTRVHGKVVGGGCGIVAASDYVFAVEKAAMRLSELAVGLGPFVVGPAIERKVGHAAYSAMALDADWRDSAWVESHGLYTHRLPDVAALDAAMEPFVARLAAANPDATAGIKRVCWLGTEGWEALLDARATMSGEHVLSAHTRAAIAAFKAS
ncbi:MAG: enoyl-CoA hydratase/isomerase family protein [Gemmatimonadaceae bacterium]|nr:enoyl-CoA hydratase/isomerase family protein [Gemmatimonadaceae bacterium]